jgi:hypothetical protein
MGMGWGGDTSGFPPSPLVGPCCTLSHFVPLPSMSMNLNNIGAPCTPSSDDNDNDNDNDKDKLLYLSCLRRLTLRPTASAPTSRRPEIPKSRTLYSILFSYRSASPLPLIGPTTVAVTVRLRSTQLKVCVIIILHHMHVTRAPNALAMTSPPRNFAIDNMYSSAPTPTLGPLHVNLGLAFKFNQ